MVTYGNTYTSSTTGASSAEYGDGIPEETAGLHNSHVANAMDPRVDSDLDGPRKVGAHPAHNPGVGNAGTQGIHGAGYSNAVPEGIAVPYNGRVANTVDPRLDSDVDGSHNMGAHNTSTTAAPTMTGVHTSTGKGSGIGGIFAQFHGAGEAVRGAFNSKVDYTFNAVSLSTNEKSVIRRAGEMRFNENEMLTICIRINKMLVLSKITMLPAAV
jgi:hypothetical protein